LLKGEKGRRRYYLLLCKRGSKRGAAFISSFAKWGAREVPLLSLTLQKEEQER
jgi:hypothetical protein